MRGPTMWGRGRMPALVTAAALLLAGSGMAAQAVLTDVGALTGALGLGPGPAPAPPAPAAAPMGYEATASGVVVHAGTLAQLLSVDVARSAAGASEAGGPPAAGDLGRVELPSIPAGGSSARGAGLLTALGGGGAAPSQASGPVSGAEASAPPNSGLVRREGTPIDLLGLVRGAILRAEAQARAAQTGCVVGSDLSHARGEAGEVTVVGAAAMGGAGLPVSHSLSRTVVVPAEGGRLALRAETRQRFSPVTFLAGTPSQFSIHTEGEWMLRAEADGQRGSVTFGPADTGSDGVGRSVRIIGSSGQVLAEGVPAGDGTGLRLAVAGLAEIVVGEAPRAPGSAGPAVVTGERVAAAVDLVRVRLLGQDLRVGHMEAAVAVPAGGMRCPAASATLTLPTGGVDPGAEFPVTVRITNPNDGILTVPAVTVRFAADGAAFEVLPDDGAQVAGAVSTLPAFTVPAGGVVERRARVRVGPASGPGTFRVEMNGDGSYGPEPGTPPGSGAVIPVGLRAAAEGPSVIGSPVVPAPRPAPAAAPAPAPAPAPGSSKPAAAAAAKATPVAPAPPPPSAAAEPTPARADPASVPAPGPPPPITGAAPQRPSDPPEETGPERAPRDEETAAPAPDGDDEDASRWAWGLLALGMIAGVFTAARRTGA